MLLVMGRSAKVEPQMTDVAAKQALGEMLVERGLLSSRDLDRALLAKREMGGLLGDVLIRLGLVAETELAAILCEHLGVSLASKSDYPSEPIDLDAVPEQFLLNHRVVPLSISNDEIAFAAHCPQDPFISKALKLATGSRITMRLGLAGDLDAALELRGQQEDETDEDSLSLINADDDEFIEHLKDLASEAPVIQRVNQIIQRSLEIDASDIHLECFEDGLRLRYRIDGVLQESSQAVDTNSAAAIISRIKLLANLNIAERRLPQDGRIMTRVKGHELDLRVSTLPTIHGEGVVMRVLDRESIRLSLDDMGFSDDTLDHYQSLLNKPHGVLLLTGPTGSGKQRHSMRRFPTWIPRRSKSLLWKTPSSTSYTASTNPVHSQIGLTFARALRSILRQDPDVIMIGEMRDTETAQIAVQSALTGHLVLSTLHTNTAAGAITRLEDMGVERFLITAAVNGVLSQRLIRRLCDHCKKPVVVTPDMARETGLSEVLDGTPSHIYESSGCDHCKNTGYSGRLAIHELFVIDAGAQRAVVDGADASQLHEYARSRGMRTLYEDGLKKVATGLSSLDEVLRITQDQTIELENDSHVA